MNKEFVCTIDHAKFTSEHALIQHLLSKYTLTQDQGANSSDILKELQDAFPTASIEVTNSIYGDKETSHINLYIPDCGGDFNFRIAEVYDSEEFYGETVYKSANVAIHYYQQILAEKDKLVDAVKQKFNSDKVEVYQVYADDDSSSITFSFYINSKEYKGYYEFEGIEQCLRSLDGYFVTTIEGECTLDYGRYDSTNTIYIDGINIKDLALRAKRLKVEIIEGK